MILLTAETLYVVAGLFLGLVALQIARDPGHPSRWGSAAFWALLGATLAAAGRLPPAVVGYAVLGLVALAATGRVKPAASRAPATAAATVSADRIGNALFLPALLIPATAVLGAWLLPRVHFGGVRLVDPRHATLIALGLGALGALAAALRLTRDRPAAAVREGGRLLQAIGWAVLLPQMLAALGGVFADAGVGEVIAGLIGRVLPLGIRPVAVLAYCLGMLLFTVCLGNAFAAFAVITGGIGLPVLVQQHGGNPAIIAALGMLSGYCGTLLTPMAANFNLVPAMLLELGDRHAVIKAQAPLAAVVFLGNLVLMETCAFRF